MFIFSDEKCVSGSKAPPRHAGTSVMNGNVRDLCLTFSTC